MIATRARFLRSLVAVPALIGVLAAAGPAVAQPTTVTATVGPVAIPAVPVSVCVDNGTNKCVQTPPATTVGLTVSTTVDPGAVTPPTILPGACSNGQGVALVVNTGSAGTVISGSVTVTVNGSPAVIPIGLPATPPNQTVIVSACVTPGVGVPATPTLPGLPTSPGLPNPPGTPDAGGLIAGLVNTILGLLGGGPSLPGIPV
jgi:hypothetical protein